MFSSKRQQGHRGHSCGHRGRGRFLRDRHRHLQQRLGHARRQQQPGWRFRIRRGIQRPVRAGRGGTVGTVSSVSSSGFTLTTATGQKVTIKEASSTTYEQGTSAATVSAVTTGEPVLVLGTTDSTTITAAQVIVQPPATSASNPGGQVIGYSQGEQGSSEQVGQIPADYTQGSGTLVSGTAADKATEAALAAYPGGVVDRVVALGNGDYEVHYIGVNWPHHIFVNQDFQVIGADD